MEPRARAGSRKPSTRTPVVVGIADHSGWAILVSVAAVNGEPAVVDRRRVPLVAKAVPNQPYEHDTRVLGEDEAEHLVAAVKRSAAVCTGAAFDRLSEDLWPRYRVAGVTIRRPPLERLPATVREVHDSYHVLCRADAMLYHSVLCAVARERGWTLTLHRRGEELAIAAAALRASVGDVERFITGLKQTLKAPWSAEHRHACAAAIGQLTRPRLP